MAAAQVQLSCTGRRIPNSSKLACVGRSTHGVRPAGPFRTAEVTNFRCPQASKDAVRQSFDSEDELDRDLATELHGMADPKRLEKLAKHFELAWKIRSAGLPRTCDCCKGTKEADCQWCSGTGYLTVGDQVYLSGTAHTNRCPVCKGKGYVQCGRCRGTGFRANWMPSDDELLP